MTSLNNSEIEDTVIRTYLELYLAALNDKRSQRYINNIKDRMQELVNEERYGNEREVWKLQIVWEYLKKRYEKASSQNGYLN